jgi:hypothetical protein
MAIINKEELIDWVNNLSDEILERIIGASNSGGVGTGDDQRLINAIISNGVGIDVLPGFNRVIYDLGDIEGSAGPRGFSARCFGWFEDWDEFEAWLADEDIKVRPADFVFIGPRHRLWSWHLTSEELNWNASMLEEYREWYYEGEWVDSGADFRGPRGWRGPYPIIMKAEDGTYAWHGKHWSGEYRELGPVLPELEDRLVTDADGFSYYEKFAIYKDWDLGKISGPRGPVGPSVRIVAAFDTMDEAFTFYPMRPDNPPGSVPTFGDAVYIRGEDMVHLWVRDPVDNQFKWSPIGIVVKGPQGDEGPKGDKGDQGEVGPPLTIIDLNVDKVADAWASNIGGEFGYGLYTHDDGLVHFWVEDRGDGQEGWNNTGIPWRGKQGEQGDDGKSAYEVAVDDGFAGTETDWLESLKGENGKNGFSIWITDSELALSISTLNVDVIPVPFRSVQMGDIILSRHEDSAGYYGQVTYTSAGLSTVQYLGTLSVNVNNILGGTNITVWWVNQAGFDALEAAGQLDPEAWYIISENANYTPELGFGDGSGQPVPPIGGGGGGLSEQEVKDLIDAEIEKLVIPPAPAVVKKFTFEVPFTNFAAATTNNSVSTERMWDVMAMSSIDKLVKWTYTSNGITDFNGVNSEVHCTVGLVGNRLYFFAQNHKGVTSRLFDGTLTIYYID